MKGWPPQPGLTVMQSASSISPPTSASASGGVPGLIATPAAAPASWISPTARARWGVASAWTVTESAPARTKSSALRSGRSIIRCASTAPPASWTVSASAADDVRADRDRRHEVAVHHVDVDHARPAARTSCTCSRSRPKSAERIDGATCTCANSSRAVEPGTARR